MIRFVYHISDVHIRLFHRHDEYRVVFEKLYSALRTHSGRDSAIIVITGDILHNKLDLTPECCTLVYEFIKTLGGIAPVFFIAGNHDANLNNRQRLDSLTAIFHERLPPNTCYLRDTGVYSFDNLFLVVNSVLDDHDWIHPRDIEKSSDNQKIICLYHGQVGRWCNNSGFYSDACERLPSDFEGADLVLLGDIHKHQYIGNCRSIAYAGSLISQNFSETDDDHGVMIWDCISRTSYLQRIDNPYAFKELYMHTDHIVYNGKRAEIDNILLPEKATVRIFMDDGCQDSLFRLQSLYPMLRVQKHFSEHVNAPCNDTPHGSMADMDLIREYCRTHDGGEFAEELCTFSQQYMSTKEESTDWQITRLRFSHMFGYDRDNEIDFTLFDPQQIVGIFGANSSGKSTLVDILLFMLYGKISRCTSGNTTPREIIHHNQDRSTGEIEISMGMERYIITKHCRRQKTGKIRIDQRLFRLLPQGHREELTDEHRRRTDRLIIEKIGSMENFLFTNFMLQQREKSFRDMTQSARKDFMHHILCLDMFDDLKKQKEEHWKELKTEISVLERNMGYLTTADIEKRQTDLAKQHTSLLSQLQDVQRQLERDEQTEKDILRQIAPLDTTQPDRESLRHQLEQETEHLQTCLERYNEASLILLTMDQEKLACQREPVLKDQFTYEEWQMERVRAKQLIQNFDTFKSAWEFEETTLRTQLEELQASLPLMTDTSPLCAETDFRKVLHDFVDDSSDWEKKRRRLQRIVEVAAVQEKGIMDVRKTIKDYQMLQQQYDCLTSILTNDENVQYNQNCPQCMTNPYYLQRKERLESINTNRKRLEELKQDYVDSCRYEKNYLDAQAAAMELLQVDRFLDDIRKKRHWLEQQKTMRKRKDLLCKMESIKLMMERSPLRTRWMEVQRLVAMIPQYEEMDNYWKSNPVLLAEKTAQKDDLRLEIDQGTQKIDHLKRQIAMAEIYLRDYENNRKLQKQLHNVQTLVVKQRTQLKTIGDQLQTVERELFAMTQQAVHRKELDGQLSVLKERHKHMDRMIRILDRDGLPLFLLSHYVEAIERDLNQIVSPFMNKWIVFHIEDKEIVFGSSEGGHVSTFYGGMEAFIVDMAMKICVGRVGKMPRSGIFIIDEGISVLDQERIAGLNQIFDFLLSFNRNVFIMSHLPTVKDFVNRRIDIVKAESYSRLVIS